MKWEIQMVPETLLTKYCQVSLCLTYILIIPSFCYIKIKLNKLSERLIIEMIGNDSIFPEDLNWVYYIADQSTQYNVD